MPDVSRNVTALLNLNIAFEGASGSSRTFQPYINDPNLGSISGDVNIARFLVKSCASSSVLYGENEKDCWIQAQIDQVSSMY